MEACGFNATIFLEENGVRIKPGIVGNMLGGGNFLSEKFIPYSTISGIELKKGFLILIEGYLKINTFGEGTDINPSINSGEAVEENVIRFSSLQNKDFEEVAKAIKESIGKE